MSDLAGRQVIVLISGLAVAGRQLEAEDIVATLGSTAPDSRVSEGLGYPVKARFSISDRLPETYRQALDPRDPEEILQRYIVLNYATIADADSALRTIKTLPGALWAGKSSIGHWSATTPNDTYYEYRFSPKDFQWGTNDPLNLQSAWDNVKGTAYVGHIDNGIQLGHSELDNMSAPWTTAFRTQLSKDFIAGSDYAIYFTNLNGVDEALYYGFAGHGSHTAGIIAASSNNGAGVAGVCWSCSLIVAKMWTEPIIWQNAMYWAVRAGAQVLNFSGQVIPAPPGGCAADPNNPACQALEFARGRDVVIVASSGNMHNPSIDFPASDPRAIAVGGIQYSGYSSIAALWLEEDPDSHYDVVGSNYGPQQSFVAPARDVLSTVYSGRDWSPYARCGDSTTFTTPEHGTQTGSVAGLGYGTCTGTSMAAPYVSGVAALIRSINPLWTRAQVFEFLRASASRASTWDQYWGYGVPNAGNSVAAAIAATNRLTPLFALYSASARDYMYTTVPQVAISAYRGLLPPRANDTAIPYTTIGTTVNEYPSFPILYPSGNEPPPRAQVWIFTTDKNPWYSQPLVPLYRLSWKCGDPGSSPACATNPIHVEHTYATSTAEIQSFMALGYKLDGIEGYIVGSAYNPPRGTVALYRGYRGSSSVDDWAVFPSTELANMNSQGYVTNGSLQMTGIIGYVHLNTGTRPTY